MKEAITRLHAIMPDLKYSIDDIIAEKGKAVVRATARFTHDNPVPTKEFGSAQPTGKEIEYAIIFVFHFSEGKLREGRLLFDAMARLEQLGVLPGSGK